jgi:chromosome partitioning protein
MTGPRILAIANQKGGVGKTTSTVNLGDYLAAAGQRVLVIDADPQGNTRSGFGISERACEYTLYTVLHNPKRGVAYAVKSIAPGLDVLPATLDLSAAEWELNSATARETLLRRALAAAPLPYDWVLIDTAPGFTLVTQNALAAAHAVLAPVSAELYPLNGLIQLERTIGIIAETVNPTLHLGGLVITMVDPRSNLTRDVIAEIRRRYGARVYQTMIPRSIRLTEAPGAGQPIRRYAPDSPGARAYEQLAQEVLHAKA